MNIRKNILKYMMLSLVITTAFYAAEQPKPATSFTKEKNEQVLRELPFNDTQDYEDAKRGFIDTIPDKVIKNNFGSDAWNLKDYDFLDSKKVPDSVNPSLWRIAQLNKYNGLFKVTDKVYQIRGFDLSNMTIIEGNTGLIIIDPLTAAETAKAGLDLYYKNFSKKPVKAVIYTHSHGDHYGGIHGVVDEKDVKSGKVKIYAPEGFLQEASSENVYAGNAMNRRGTYQYGPGLARGEKGQIDAGLGKTVPIGSVGLIRPTDIISKTGETKNIDGIQVEFIMAPGTEAPAEMLMYFPQFKMVNAAEDATHTLHNLYTLRGAQVRDAMTWWKTLDYLLADYGDKTEVIIAQHHWPKWGQENIKGYLAKQRDIYKYIHDQTLRLANEGYTMNEIAEKIDYPNGLDKEWSVRGYYGSLSHDTKAVYQRYLGWYDSNPANLNPLPPEEASKRYVEFMGGSKAVIKKAKEYYNKGEYRWVAEVMNRVVFAEPENQEAKNLAADALEQLGYQAEDPTWRNEYLVGAYELRNGTPKIPTKIGANTPDAIKAMTMEMYMDYMGIRLNADRAEGKQLTLNLELPDIKEKYAVNLENSVLGYRKVDTFKNEAEVTLTINRDTLDKIQMGETTLDKEIASGNVKVNGNTQKLKEYMGLFDNFKPDFNIVTP